MASVPLQRRAASSTQTGSVPRIRVEGKPCACPEGSPARWSLLRAVPSCGACKATWAAPWARPLPSSPVTRTPRTRASCGCRLPWAATSTSSRTSAPAVPGSPQRRRQRRHRRLVALRVHREQRTLVLATLRHRRRFPVPRAESDPDASLRQHRVLPRRPGGTDHAGASVADLALQRHACPAILGRPVAGRTRGQRWRAVSPR